MTMESNDKKFITTNVITLVVVMIVITALQFWGGSLADLFGIHTVESDPVIDTCGSKDAKVVRFDGGVACIGRSVVVAMRGR